MVHNGCMQSQANTFAFFLVPGFSLVALSSAIDVLRAANVEVDRTHFEWSLLGEESGVVASSSGIELPVEQISADNRANVIAVCGGERTHLFANSKVEKWLRDCAREHCRIGSLSDGAYLVAKAGLFNQCRSTIHWKCQNAYRELYPNLDVRTSIMEIDALRFSCAGGTASLDLMLNFVASSLGTAIAGRVADNYFHDVIRGDDQTQHLTRAFRFATRNETVSNALFKMEAALEAPIPVAQIADELNVSHRQLDRLFRTHLGASPSRFYRDLRLARASSLLKQTALSVAEVAVSCGFQSASHLAKFFHQKYDETPLQHRKKGPQQPSF